MKMFVIGVVGAALALTGVAVPAAYAVTNDIVGGYEATGPWPGMASLQIDRGPDDPLHHTCGIVLASRSWLAVNAHCVTDFGSSVPRAASLYHVRAGSLDRTTGGTLAGVAKIVVHHGWAWQDGPGEVDDIAMVKLDTSLPYQQFEVLTAANYNSRAKATMLGWGITEPDGTGPAPLKLQQLDTKGAILPAATCADLLIGVGELCVNNPHGTDGVCRGDSGGPILQQVPGSHPARAGVIGLTSRGLLPCGIAPSIFTDAGYFRAWMFLVMAYGQDPAGPPPAARSSLAKPGKVWTLRHEQCLELRACNQ